MDKKIGFALGAGGSRGVAHIGFLKAMEENGIYPDFVVGSSMGAVVGGCYSVGLSPDKMIEEVDKLKFSDIFDLSLNPIGSGALLRAKKVRKKLLTYFDKTKFNETKIPFNCVSVDMTLGKKHLFEPTDYVIDGVVASLSIPAVFRAPEQHGTRLIDGGILCRVPVDEVRDMGADVVIAVDVLGEIRPSNKKHNLIGVLFRMQEIMDSELTKLKIEKSKPDLYLTPDLGEMSQFKFKDLRFAFDMGYKCGIENANEIKQILAVKNGKAEKSKKN